MSGVAGIRSLHHSRKKGRWGGSGEKGKGGESFSLSCLPIIFGMTRAEESEEMRR